MFMSPSCNMLAAGLKKSQVYPVFSMKLRYPGFFLYSQITHVVPTSLNDNQILNRSLIDSSHEEDKLRNTVIIFPSTFLKLPFDWGRVYTISFQTKSYLQNAPGSNLPKTAFQNSSWFSHTPTMFEYKASHENHEIGKFRRYISFWEECTLREKTVPKQCPWGTWPGCSRLCIPCTDACLTP